MPPATDPTELRRILLNRIRHALLCGLGGFVAALLSMTAASAQTPEKRNVDDARLEQLRRITRARVVYTVDGMDAVEARRDLVYKVVDGTGLAMDVYLPSGLAEGERRPAVLFVHGGPMPPGLALPPDVPRPKNWGTFESYGEIVAASGFVGVTFNHRYRSLTALDDSTGDLDAAMGYVREHAAELHVDPERLALWVFSGAGPHLSLVLRERPSYVRCLVSFYPVLDFAAFAAMGMGEVPPELAEKYSPQAHLHDAAPPILMARAGRDQPAINQGIESFLAAALEKGVAVDFLNHPQGMHGFDVMNDDERSREIVRHALAFLATHLGR